MKSELRLKKHLTEKDAKVIEIWYNREFIGAVYGADGPGVRIVSKYLRNSSAGIKIVAVEPPALEISLEK